MTPKEEQQKKLLIEIMDADAKDGLYDQMTAVEYIEKGIKVREKHWHDQYQQGYQRALSDIMTLLEDAKSMEEDQSNKDYQQGYEEGYKDGRK